MWKYNFCATVLAFATAAAAGTSADAGSDPCPLYLHDNAGGYETAFGWSFGGVQAPTYGAFAERYAESLDICGVVLDLTASAGGQTGTADIYIWEDGGGQPGAVLELLPGFDPGAVAVWPSVSRHVAPLTASCSGAPVWVGFWGAWPDQDNPWSIAADTNGAAGDPQTNIAPGQGFPAGWNDVSAVWGPTQSIGIGVLGLECGTTGACCLPDLTCQVLTVPECAATSGEFFGAGEPCSPNPCANAGACCFGEVCAVIDEPSCLAGLGSYEGDQTVCDPSPCALPSIGACCFVATCVVTEECPCENNGGIYIGDGSSCDPGPCGGVPDIAFSANSFEFTVVPGAGDQAVLTLSNVGTANLDWSVTEVEVLLLDNGPSSMRSPTGTRLDRSPGNRGDSASSAVIRHPVSRLLPSSEAFPSETQAERLRTSFAGGDAVPMVIDDGSIENSIGLGGGGQFVWFNRFTPDPGSFPFKMSQVEILFPIDAGVDVGELVDIYVYEDVDGDGDPATGAVVVGELHDAAVQFADDATWSVYAFPPVVLHGPGDVLIAVVNRTAGILDGEFPASIDYGSLQLRSWISADSGDPGDPPVFPGTSLWGLIDDFVAGGNWMLRGLGEKGGGDCEWLTVDITSGTELPSEDQPLLISVDATGLPEGSYQCDLLFTSNDPDETEVTIPVTLTVSTAASTEESEESSSELRLYPTHPNPSSSQTRIEFVLSEEGLVRLEIFDARGRRIARLVDESLPAGRHGIDWSGDDFSGQKTPSGVYFYRLETAARVEERKLVRVR